MKTGKYGAGNTGKYEKYGIVLREGWVDGGLAGVPPTTFEVEAEEDRG